MFLSPKRPGKRKQTEKIQLWRLSGGEGASITISILFYVRHTETHEQRNNERILSNSFCTFARLSRPDCNPPLPSRPIVLIVSLLMIFFRSVFPKISSLCRSYDCVEIKLIERVKCANPCWNKTCIKQRREEELWVGWTSTSRDKNLFLHFPLSPSFHPQNAVFSCMFRQKKKSQQN